MSYVTDPEPANILPGYVRCEVYTVVKIHLSYGPCSTNVSDERVALPSSQRNMLCSSGVPRNFFGGGFNKFS